MKYMTAEPFKIKMVEHIHKTTIQERQKYLKEADYNVFNLRSSDVYIDCLTDSGVTAMSDQQWAAMMKADEAYSGSKSFYKLNNAAQDIFDIPYVQPTHQGRAADFIVARAYTSKGKHTIGNMHFITYLEHAKEQKSLSFDAVVSQHSADNLYSKGDIDIARLTEYIEKYHPENISAIIISATCNNNGGQPVSLKNLKAVYKISSTHNIPIVLDAARIMENAYFIKLYESKYTNKSIKYIVREMCSYCETVVMSAKKDALVNIGGLFMTRNSEIFKKAQKLVLQHEGFITYGGLAGRDLEAIAQGLYEGSNEEYLSYRYQQVQYLAHLLEKKGIPIINPVGGHGVYINANKFFPHIPNHELPSQRLVTALYEQAGIRTVEMNNTPNDSNNSTAINTVRIAIPRRTYTNNHLKVIAQALGDIYIEREKYKGMKIQGETSDSPLGLFTAKYSLQDH